MRKKISSGSQRENVPDVRTANNLTPKATQAGPDWEKFGKKWDEAKARNKANPIAICCSDLHLSLQMPACRADKDWMQVQAEYLAQLKNVAKKLNVPVICAGDIFDRWNVQPELINFALEYLPSGMFCVPGQHDLPNHNLEEMHRSGYGVLKEVGKIKDLSGKQRWEYNVTTEDDIINLEQDNVSFLAVGFGWGQEIDGQNKNTGFTKSEISELQYIVSMGCKRIAIIHRYCWYGESKYIDAPKEAHVKDIARGGLHGYDFAIFGDNHQKFTTEFEGCQIVNCGGFIRRKADEMDYAPAVWILFDDGSAKEHKLDTSGDRFHENAKERRESEFDLQGFLKTLEKLGECALDFRTTVENYLESNKMTPAVKQVILKALETKV